MAKPKPYLVRPQLTEDELRSEIRTAGGKISVADLMHRSGLSRAIVRRLVNECKGAPKAPIKPPERPKPTPVQIAHPVLKLPAPVPAKPSRIFQGLIGGGCALISLAFGAVGMVMNYRFAYSFGQDEFSSVVLGCLGLAVDGAALVLLPAAGALGEQRRYGQCLLACLIWLPFVGLSTVAAMGFAGSNIGDSLQGRDSVIQHRGTLEAELAAAKLERWKIIETRDPLVLEQQIQVAQTNVPFQNWKSSQGCTAVTVSVVCLDLIRLREAKMTAERRIRLDDKIHELAEATAKLPQIAVKDPAADQIAQMTFGLVAAEQVGNYRVRGLAIVPGFASILLAFARALLR